MMLVKFSLPGFWVALLLLSPACLGRRSGGSSGYQPCSEQLGSSFRCVNARNCGSKQMQGQASQDKQSCGPGKLGVCCPVMSSHSNKRCGIRFPQLFSQREPNTSIRNPSLEGLLRQVAEFGGQDGFDAFGFRHGNFSGTEKEPMSNSFAATETTKSSTKISKVEEYYYYDDETNEPKSTHERHQTTSKPESSIDDEKASRKKRQAVKLEEKKPIWSEKKDNKKTRKNIRSVKVNVNDIADAIMLAFARDFPENALMIEKGNSTEILSAISDFSKAIDVSYRDSLNSLILGLKEILSFKELESNGLDERREKRQVPDCDSKWKTLYMQSRATLEKVLQILLDERNKQDEALSPVGNIPQMDAAMQANEDNREDAVQNKNPEEHLQPGKHLNAPQSKVDILTDAGTAGKSHVAMAVGPHHTAVKSPSLISDVDGDIVMDAEADSAEGSTAEPTTDKGVKKAGAEKESKITTEPKTSDCGGVALNQRLVGLMDSMAYAPPQVQYAPEPPPRETRTARPAAALEVVAKKIPAATPKPVALSAEKPAALMDERPVALMDEELQLADKGAVKLSGSTELAGKGPAKLSGSMEQADKGTARLSGSMGLAGKGPAKLSGSMEFAGKGPAKLSGSMEQAGKGAPRLSGSMEQAGKGAVKLSGSMEQADRRAARLSGSMEQAGKGPAKMSGSMEQAGKGAGSMEKRLSGLSSQAAKGGSGSGAAAPAAHLLMRSFHNAHDVLERRARNDAIRAHIPAEVKLTEQSGDEEIIILKEGSDSNAGDGIQFSGSGELYVDEEYESEKKARKKRWLPNINGIKEGLFLINDKNNVSRLEMKQNLDYTIRRKVMDKKALEQRMNEAILGYNLPLYEQELSKEHFDGIIYHQRSPKVKRQDDYDDDEEEEEDYNNPVINMKIVYNVDDKSPSFAKNPFSEYKYPKVTNNTRLLKLVRAGYRDQLFNRGKFAILHLNKDVKVLKPEGLFPVYEDPAFNASQTSGNKQWGISDYEDDTERYQSDKSSYGLLDDDVSSFSRSRDFSPESSFSKSRESFSKSSLSQSREESLPKSLSQSREESLPKSLSQSLEESLPKSLYQSREESLPKSLSQSREESLPKSLSQSREESLPKSSFFKSREESLPKSSFSRSQESIPKSSFSSVGQDKSYSYKRDYGSADLDDEEYDLETLAPQQVIGGRNEDQPWPWIVAIYELPSRKFVCGGTLIDPRHILSAAHCFHKFKPKSQFAVIVGSLRRYDTKARAHGDRLIPVTHLFVHEGFEMDCYCNDIALLRIGQTLGPEVTPACLPQYDPAGPGEHCTVVGWGDTEYHTKKDKSGVGTGILQRVDDLIIYPKEACKNIMSKIAGRPMPSTFGEYYICAGVPDGRKDACIGDSGGPLMHEDYEGIWSLIGIVSFGYKCGEPGVPGTYTRITYFLPWIMKTIDSP